MCIFYCRVLVLFQQGFQTYWKNKVLSALVVFQQAFMHFHFYVFFLGKCAKYFTNLIEKNVRE